MRRILMVLTVMAVMAAMLVVMAAPAFASKTFPRELPKIRALGDTPKGAS